MLEREIEAYLRKRVKEAGGIAYKFVSPTNRGVADRVVCLPNGQTWFVELKSSVGKLTPLQVQFAIAMSNLKQNYKLIRSKAEVDEWLLNT